MGNTVMVKAKKAKLANAPKKPRTTYIAYSMELREQGKLADLKSFKEQAAYIKEHWDKLDASEKKRLQDDFDKENEVYKKALANYMSSDLYINDCEAAVITPKKIKTPTAYNLFASHHNKSSSKDGKENNASEVWANMSEEDKEVWKKKALELKK